MTFPLIIALLALLVWDYLLFFRGGFWRAEERDDADRPALPVAASWPRVTAVIPARNEAAVLPQSLGSLLAQDYPAAFSIIVVDDDSSDGTAAAARKVAAKSKREVVVIESVPLPSGWTGKLWAVCQGITHASTVAPGPDYLLLTDADIAYAPEALRLLVARTKAKGLVLTSIMAKLNCESFVERALVPAFVFFFQMLYPFAWVNQRNTRTAAAAGGCMLVERAALKRAGGIAKIRSALIDDCALARVMKAEGPIWLGLSNRMRSLRQYPHFDEIGQMVARSAYAQLGYSPFLLAATVAGMAFAYLIPPILLVFGPYPANVVAAATWALMALAFLPILRFYRLSWTWAPALPLIAAVYLGFTLSSAWQHWQGRGSTWKGRTQALAAKQ
jgi:hopene-associated glycosyltransferase HpnB